ncbi:MULTISPECIES: DUF423 domain-containing protein [Agrobacterium]|uniref:DUF423 domain-containing protein n=1 Tax=Agrobacterium TaxID=357 RepID=UPI001571C73C|nr:DUF423 domain-containing protein [Agrobacterium tumefaciens]NTE35256.1 DUF423 domain-containing protein [Agrobacterium tumefaciens]NTE50766.1 DUF423 domain-containing protein [Agrobacterium tumefaciens]WCA58174.1 DUF423 domain-containing protein [Agrobacterium tumefaciens]
MTTQSATIASLPRERLRAFILLLGGLLGAAGVMLAAAATHTGETYMLGNASAMALAHAPVLVALHIGADRIRTAVPAGLILGLGTAVFVGDLVTRHFSGHSLFPYAAPTGGLGMIGGWLVLCAGAFLKPKG